LAACRLAWLTGMEVSVRRGRLGPRSRRRCLGKANCNEGCSWAVGAEVTYDGDSDPSPEKEKEWHGDDGNDTSSIKFEADDGSDPHQNPGSEGRIPGGVELDCEHFKTNTVNITVIATSDDSMGSTSVKGEAVPPNGATRVVMLGLPEEGHSQADEEETPNPQRRVQGTRRG